MKSGGWYWWRNAALWIVGPLPNGYVLVVDEDGDPFELLPEQIEHEVTDMPRYWSGYRTNSWRDRLGRLRERILYGRSLPVPPPVPPPIPPSWRKP